MAYFVIVDVATTKQYQKPGEYSTKIYETERGAKCACTRLNEKGVNSPIYVVMSLEAYRIAYPAKMVERTNLMSGLKYMEAEDTPNFCSPASESYWSA